MAPAQAAPTSNTVTVPMACAFSTFTIQYPAQVALTVDGTAVSATLSDIPPTGMPTFLTVVGADATVNATVDGDAVSLTGSTTYAATRTGNPPITLPTVAGTRTATADLGSFSISTVAVTMWVKTNPAATPIPQNMTCTAIPAKTVTDTQGLTCVFQDFGIAYPAELSVNAHGSKLAGNLARTFAPGMPAFVTVSTLKVDLQANVATPAAAPAAAASTPVTLTGSETYATPKPGNSQFTFPALTGTRSGSILAPDAIDITGATITITAMGADNVINCVPTAAPAATTTALTATATGNAVKLAAAVTPAVAGTVEFKDGATSLGKVTLAAGAAKLDLANVAIGAHSYTATFVPTNALSYAGSTSGAQAVTIVNPACAPATADLATATAALTKATSADKKAKAAVKKATAAAKKAAKSKNKAKIAKAKKALKAAKSRAAKSAKALKSAKAAVAAAAAAKAAVC
ncbi:MULTISPECIES: Ig-like domain repeat protein [Nocardioides]|uniref:Ig-like domain repeat protein n=1 Tax=Nocardioides TaxID=1839 RepID=UPI0018E02A8F|nr:MULTISPECIES: Ig-like domain repeat protein [unclassified Nocardioides]